MLGYSLLKLRLLKIAFKSQFWCRFSLYLLLIYHFSKLPSFFLLFYFFYLFSTLSLSCCLERTKCSFLFNRLLLIFSSSQLLPFYTSTASCSQTAQSSPHLYGGARLCPYQAHQSAICPWDRYRDRRRYFIPLEATSLLSMQTKCNQKLPKLLPVNKMLHINVHLACASSIAWILSSPELHCVLVTTDMCIFTISPWTWDFNVWPPVSRVGGRDNNADAYVKHAHYW